MDQNEDVSKELFSHTSKLSTYLHHFKRKSNLDDGDELTSHLDDLHKELGCVHNKVQPMDSSGRLKKAFLANDHAEELKGYQDTIQVHGVAYSSVAGIASTLANMGRTR